VPFRLVRQHDRPRNIRLLRPLAGRHVFAAINNAAHPLSRRHLRSCARSGFRELLGTLPRRLLVCSGRHDANGDALRRGLVLSKHWPCVAGAVSAVRGWGLLPRRQHSAGTMSAWYLWGSCLAPDERVPAPLRCRILLPLGFYSANPVSAWPLLPGWKRRATAVPAGRLRQSGRSCDGELLGAVQHFWRYSHRAGPDGGIVLLYSVHRGLLLPESEHGDALPAGFLLRVRKQRTDAVSCRHVRQR
jgi:hypothetical protein